MKIHEKYIKRCLEISKNGYSFTRPNPSVGAIVVCNNKIIGEGFTSSYGNSHAEVNAINSVENKNLLKKSTLYVSLEPCSHHGKTPPCSHLIVESGIQKIVIGCKDDNPQVGGKGIEFLKNNGCEVLTGILEEECRKSHNRFFTFHQKKRPYIILKWAETKDGFIDKLREENSSQKSPNWISNKYSQQLVHKWRSEEQSVLVGTNTVLTDNPKLSVRKWVGNNPIRLILDNSMRIPHEFHVLDGSIKTIVFTGSTSLFEQKNKNIQVEFIDYTKSIPEQICEILYKNNIQSVIIEGGAQTLRSFINNDLWDEARVFIGNKCFGNGLKAPEIEGVINKIEYVDDDILKIIFPVNQC